MQMDLLAWLTIVLGCAAAFEDLRRRIISNWISLAAVASGLILHTVQNGLAGLGGALAGGVIGFAVFLVFYCLGGMGGGDVKLMAGFGTLLGPSGILVAAVFAAIIGAVMAISSIVFRPGRPSIPYGPAIVAGAWLSLMARN